MSQCVKYVVRGRVQGVWYRQSALEQATELGLKGWVRNCADGAVELLACGDQSKLEALQTWLWQGPPHARVSEVTSRPADEEPPAGFTVLR